MGDPTTKTQPENFKIEKILDPVAKKRVDLISWSQSKKTTTYHPATTGRQQKTPIFEPGKCPATPPKNLQECLSEVAVIGAKIDEKCDRLINAYLANQRVHKVILKAIQETETDKDYELFVVGLSEVIRGYRNGKNISIREMMKKISDQNDDLTAKFLINQVSPILQKIGIFRNRNETQYRWANYNELQKMVVAATKANVRSHRNVQKAENVHSDVQKADVHVQSNEQSHDAHVHTQPSGLIAKLNEKINQRNLKALEKRKQKRLQEAKFDPWKRVLPDGTIEQIKYEPTEEEKEMMRRKEILEQRIRIQAEIAEMQTSEYLETYVKKETELKLKLQREEHKTQQMLAKLRLEKAQARQENWQQNKDALFNLSKLAIIFGVVLLLIFISSKMIGSEAEYIDDGFPVEQATTGDFPWE